MFMVVQQTNSPPAAEHFFDEILMDFQWKNIPTAAANEELAETLTNDDRYMEIRNGCLKFVSI